jgi:hypothetical protein
MESPFVTSFRIFSTINLTPLHPLLLRIQKPLIASQILLDVSRVDIRTTFESSDVLQIRLSLWWQ